MDIKFFSLLKSDTEINYLNHIIGIDNNFSVKEKTTQFINGETDERILLITGTNDNGRRFLTELAMLQFENWNVNTGHKTYEVPDFRSIREAKPKEINDLLFSLKTSDTNKTIFLIRNFEEHLNYLPDFCEELFQTIEKSTSKIIISMESNYHQVLERLSDKILHVEVKKYSSKEKRALLDREILLKNIILTDEQIQIFRETEFESNSEMKGWLRKQNKENTTLKDIDMEGKQVLKSIRELFKNRIFRIKENPFNYLAKDNKAISMKSDLGFKIDEKQLERLWQTVVDIKPNNWHYAGTISLVQMPSEYNWLSTHKQYAIVGEQQKIVSYFIFLTTLIEKAEYLGFEYEDTPDKPKNSFIEIRGEFKVHLFGIDGDLATSTFFKKEILNDNSIMNEIEENDSIENIRNIKLFFETSISSYLNSFHNVNAVEVLKRLYNNLTEKILFSEHVFSEE